MRSLPYQSCTMYGVFQAEPQMGTRIMPGFHVWSKAVTTLSMICGAVPLSLGSYIQNPAPEASPGVPDSMPVIETPRSTRSKPFGSTNANRPVAGSTDVCHLPVLSSCVGVLPAGCLLYTSPSPRDGLLSRMPSSA